jgi:hypothetical protein
VQALAWVAIEPPTFGFSYGALERAPQENYRCNFQRWRHLAAVIESVTLATSRVPETNCIEIEPVLIHLRRLEKAP